MKKIFTLIIFSAITVCASAQLLTEDFNYTAGDPLTSNNWTQIGTTATNPILVTTPGLTYTGYANSGVGNAATLTTSGQDIYRDASGSISSGSIYVSFLLNASSAQATGDYFFALLPTTSTSNFTARTFIKSSGAGYVLGVAKSTEAVAYGPTVLNLNTTYLVVVKYTFNTVSSTDDAISLYVFSSGIPTTEPITPEAGPQVGTAADAASLGRLALRQGSSTSAAGVTVDGFRVSSGWFNAPLPVSLLSFNAALNNKAVSLDWSTANEVNAGAFELERSVNGKDFSRISFVVAKNGVQNSYNFVDERAVAGTNYYRLKMVDKDGSFKYSQIVSVKAKSEGVAVFPNPVKANLTVQHEVAVKGATIAVIDFAGKQVAAVNVQAGATQTNLDASKFTPGSYMIVFNNDGVKLTKQFVKQ